MFTQLLPNHNQLYNAVVSGYANALARPLRCVNAIIKSLVDAIKTVQNVTQFCVRTGRTTEMAAGIQTSNILYSR